MRTIMTHCLLTMNGPLDVAEQLINAFIIAGIAFFAALASPLLAGGSITYPPAMSTVYTGVLAGGLTFFLQLSYERGVKAAPSVREWLKP